MTAMYIYACMCVVWYILRRIKVYTYEYMYVLALLSSNICYKLYTFWFIETIQLLTRVRVV